MVRGNSYQKRRKAKNRRFLLSIFLILLISSISYILLNRIMNAEINNLNTEIKSTQKKLDDVNKEITSLENDYEIRNTDQFKEKVAQERLGMVKNSDEKENDQKKAEANKESEQESVDKEISNDDNW